LKAQIEVFNSKSQIVTLNQSGTEQGGNIKYLPAQVIVYWQMQRA
jgi:hypothetical protein